MLKKLLCLAVCLCALCATVLSAGAEQQVVNIYTARHYESDKQLYALFEQQTGIKVNVVSAKAPELIERIKREAQNTAADLFITVDGGVLHTAKTSGILQPITSEKALSNIPVSLRDKDNHWLAIATRARVIVYSLERVKPEELSTYEDLANEKWRGRALARPSSSLYDQSLLASLIVFDGQAAAAKWVKDYVANFARPPISNDRAQAQDIAAGKGDVALMNTYYVGQMLNSSNQEEVKAAQAVGVFFPNQQTTGTHVNVSGVALIKHAKNVENAIRFIEFITGIEGQERLASGNYEYPANPDAKAHPLLASWGTFKRQDIDYSLLSENNPLAIRLFTQGGWK